MTGGVPEIAADSLELWRCERAPRAAGSARLVLLTLAGIANGVSGCGGGGSGSGTGGGPPPPPPPAASIVTAPVHLGVYPVDQSTQNQARIFLTITMVGSQAVQLPLALDTGSAGLTLNALAVFPGSIVGASGFQFESGQTTLSYNGITVTDQQGSRAYGGATGHTQVGNIGYAQVSFGDASGSLTSATMPVLFYYKVVSTADNQPVTESGQDGWFGINDAPNLVTVSGAAASLPACSLGVNGSCWVVSVLKFLEYGAGVDGGFIIDPVALQTCDPATAGSCTAQPALTVGITPALKSGFSVAQLPCPPPTYTGPVTIAGFGVCQERVPNTSVASAAAPGGSYVTTAIFDTGTPYSVLNVPTGTAFPTAIPSGDSIQVTTPSGFVYTQTAATGVSAIIVNSGASTNAAVIGLGYFTTNSLLVDFATETQGWK
jgi:hypothetical protein